MRKKWIAIGLAISSFLITTSPYLSISAAPLSDLQAQKNASSQKLSELEEKREEMERTLSELDADFYKLSISMNEVSERLEQCRIDLEKTSTSLAEAKQLEEEYYESMKKRICFIYENGSMNATTAFFRSRNIIDYVNNVSMVSDFTAYDRKMLREFENNHRLIASKQEELEQREATLSEQEQLFAQKQTELFDSITEQQKQLKNTNSEIKLQKERSKTIQQQLNAMLAYESFYNNQYDPNRDNYYLKATQNGYYGIPDYATHSPIIYTQQEFDILSALIYCEAGGEPYEVQLAVASVVMNRLRSPLFPDTLLGVIYQHKQFTPVLTGRHAVVLANNLTTDSCRNAANAVLNGYSSGNWLFFRVDKEHKINGTHMGVSVFY